MSVVSELSLDERKGPWRWAGVRTARIANSTALFEALRPSAKAIELDHEVVSSVVVLHGLLVCLFSARNAGAHSFANTPLKAAHAPLPIAITSHADFVFGKVMLVCY